MLLQLCDSSYWPIRVNLGDDVMRYDNDVLLCILLITFGSRSLFAYSDIVQDAIIITPMFLCFHATSSSGHKALKAMVNIQIFDGDST